MSSSPGYLTIEGDIGKPFTDDTFDDYTNITEMNLKGFLLITQPVVRHMVGQGGGHIVSTSLVRHR